MVQNAYIYIWILKITRTSWSKSQIDITIESTLKKQIPAIYDTSM